MSNLNHTANLPAHASADGELAASTALELFSVKQRTGVLVTQRCEVRMYEGTVVSVSGDANTLLDQESAWSWRNVAGRPSGSMALHVTALLLQLTTRGFVGAA